MREITDPNWLTVAGLLYFTYGAIALASIATADVGLSDTLRIAARRSVRSAFAILLLAIGGSTLAASQFVSVPFGGAITIYLLGLAFLILLSALVTDFWAERLISSASALPQQSAIILDAPIRLDNDVPAGPVLLRAAG